MTLFQSDSFAGISDTYTENTAQVRRNDDMSSLRISSGCYVILFTDANYQGKSRAVYTDLTVIGLGVEWNDQVSSFKLLPSKIRDDL